MNGARVFVSQGHDQWAEWPETTFDEAVESMKDRMCDSGYSNRTFEVVEVQVVRRSQLTHAIKINEVDA